MSDRIDNFIIREADGVRFANSLVLGRGIPLSTTAGGLPELEGVVVGETQLLPSGGDDTQAIRDALARSGRVRLGPGDFTIISPITLGTGQAVAGCGPDRTVLHYTDTLQGFVFSVSGSGTAIEELTLHGPGSGFLTEGIRTSSASDVALRGLHLTDLGIAIRLEGVKNVEVSRVTAERISTGIWIVNGEQVAITDTSVDNPSTNGLFLAPVEGLHCARVKVLRGIRGILAQGSALSFRSIRLVECVTGMTISGSSGVELAGVQTVDGRGVSFSVASSTAVSIDGCSVLRGRRSALSVAGCTAVTVNGFHSDMNNALPSTDPHVVVSGSTLVTVTSVHVVNPATPPPIEVDVSAAGGRVVFIQHDFDPARINSGGNFVAL